MIFLACTNGITRRRRQRNELGGTCPKPEALARAADNVTIASSAGAAADGSAFQPPMTEDRNLVPAKTADVGRTHRITGMRNRPPRKVDNPAADRWRAHWWGCLAEPEAIGGPAASRLRTDGEDE